jgi:Tol biopolymer transport system component
MAAAVALSLVIAAASLGSTGETLLVSGPNGTTADGFPIGDHVPAISGDGRFVAYVEDTPDSGTAIYLRDMSGGIIPVDVPTGIGPQGLGFSAGGPSLSSDGRFLAFASEDPALSSEDTDFDTTLAGDSFPVRDAFVYDRTTGAVSLVSRRSGPTGAAANDDSNFPEVSANGRYVAFATEATNFIHGVFGGIFVRDLHTQKTTLVGRANGRNGKALKAYNASISGNGKMVAFLEVIKHTHGRLEAAVRDVKRNRTILVSRENGAHGAIASNDCSDPEVSANGRYVAFASKAKNLSGADGDSVEDVFVRDLNTNRTILVSRGRGRHGAPGQGDSSNPSISANGRYVAFESYANNLGPPDNGSLVDVFVKDLRTGRVFLASRASGNGAAANAPSENPAISGNARFVAFESRGSNLNPADTLRTESVFRYQLLP